MISILLPVYNAEKYLKRCLESIDSQTSSEYQIIIVDDASTDLSKSIIKEYKEKNRKKIKVYENNMNMGLSYNRNKLIELCDTKYFIFVDADDTINNNLIAEIKKIIDKDNPDIIRYQSMLYKSGAEPENKYKCPSFTNEIGEKAVKEMLLNDKIFGQTWMYCYSKNLFIENNLQYPNGKVQEDYRLTICAIYLAKKVTSIDYIGYNYYRNPNSIMEDKSTGSLLKKANDVLSHYDELNCFFENVTDEKLKLLILRYISKGVMVKLKQLPDEFKLPYFEQICIRCIDLYSELTIDEIMSGKRQYKKILGRGKD